MPSRSAAVDFEQAVYGSFAFWDRGYAVLASSPGCLPGWLSAFQKACQGFGEPPPGTNGFGRAMVSLRLEDSGPWAIVGVEVAGSDDRGRPGALAFHALFVEMAEFRKVGFDPFRLSGALKGGWTPETTALPAGSWPVSEIAAPIPPDLAIESRRIAERLAGGRRVALESAEPIDDLARAVWNELPERVRKRARVATLAFSTSHRFDLVAVPRLSAFEWDASYADPPEKPPKRRSWPIRGIIAAAVGIAVILAFGIGLRDFLARRAETPLAVASGPPEVRAGAPDRSSYDDPPIDPDERQGVLRGLDEMAQKFGVSVPDGSGPTARMVALSAHLRYRGPLLSEADRSRLASESGPGRSRALDWDAQIRHFLPDRPLPPDFARGPLRWQLDTLGWSFRVEPDPRKTLGEIPRALADALSLDEPIRPNPLAARYPPLSDYAAFLAKLPRR